MTLHSPPQKSSNHWKTGDQKVPTIGTFSADALWNDRVRNLIVITCAKGMAPMLTAEVERLGYTPNGATETGVSITGAMRDAMRLNLQLRTAHRVLWQIGEGPARHPDELHKRMSRWPWEHWIPARGYICVTASGQSASGDDPRFVALKAKDAIVDRMKGVHGERPDSGPERNRTVVHVHWDQRFFTAYLDTSGESLSHRGYRHQPGKAPMRETLAAACLLAAPWDPATALVNPMCGSGTIAIEGALMASRTPPGFIRENFGFMHINGFPDEFWKNLRAQESSNRLIRPHKINIFASDHDPRAIEAARANARRAGVAAWIEFAVCDFREVKLPVPPGLIMYNPEYGERLGKDSALTDHYTALGDFMKHHGQGFTGAVFTGNAEMIKPIGLKPRAKIQLFNGPIEGRLLIFDLYAGTKRDRRMKRTGSPQEP